MTFQVRETLAYRGQPREIAALPLSGCDRPVPALGGLSSGCWRGYQGGWELRDDALHLVRLVGPCAGYLGEDDRNRLTEIFPEAAGSVEAVWFSGGIVSDDAIDPKDSECVEFHRGHDWPLHFVQFTLVIYRGKLLSEVATDLETGRTEGRLTRHAGALFPQPELAFLHAINTDPDDLTAKLVYADWLDEHDDPRGPLLRTEVARQQDQGSRRCTAGVRPQGVSSGSVPPADTLWFWRRLAGIPEVTLEEFRQLLSRLRATES